MVAKNAVMKVACCVMADGTVRYTLPDQTSINTALRDWNRDIAEEDRLKHKEAGTNGGVVVISMFSSDFFRIPKEFRPHDAERA